MNPTHSSESEALKKWSAKQATDNLFSNALASITGSLGVLMVLGLTLSLQPISRLSLILWFLTGVLISIGRLCLWWGYSKHFSRFTLHSWRNSYRILTLMFGILISLSVWLFYDHVSEAHQLLIMFAIVGLTAAAAGTHAVDLITFKFFMYSTCIPTAIKILLLGTPTHYALSLMFVLYILVMERTGRHNNSILHTNLELTYKMQYRATHDTLVGLLNREEFENQFE